LLFLNETVTESKLEAKEKRKKKKKKSFSQTLPPSSPSLKERNVLDT